MMLSQHHDIASAWQSSQDTAALRHAVATLGPDWQLLRPAASSRGGAAASRSSMPAVLANPSLGVILIDIAPRNSPAAVEQFRRMLGSAGFPERWPGNLPVLHRVLPREHLSRLPDIIDYALAWEAPLTIHPDIAWVARVREALTGLPGGEAGAVNRAVSRKTPPEVAAVPGEPAAAAPPLPSALLLVTCGLLIAIGGGTAAMWRFLPIEPGTSRLALTVGEDFRPTVPAATGGDAWRLPERPAPEPGFDRADGTRTPDMPALSDSRSAEAAAPPSGDQATGGTDLAGGGGRNDSIATPAAIDPGPPASPRADTVEPRIAAVAPEQVAGSDSGPPGAAMPLPEAAVAATAPDAAAGEERPPMPVSSAAGAAPGLPDAAGTPSDEAASAMPRPEQSQASPPVAPEQRPDATASAMTAPPAETEAAEPAAGAVAAASPVLPRPSEALLSNLLRRGDSLLALGDVSAARLFYDRAAANGSGKAATALGKTYDPAVLARLGIPGVSGDPALALRWYRTALKLGDAEAGQLLDKAGNLRP